MFVFSKKSPRKECNGGGGGGALSHVFFPFLVVHGRSMGDCRHGDTSKLGNRIQRNEILFFASKERESRCLSFKKEKS